MLTGKQRILHQLARLKSPTCCPRSAVWDELGREGGTSCVPLNEANERLHFSATCEGAFEKASRRHGSAAPRAAAGNNTTIKQVSATETSRVEDGTVTFRSMLCIYLNTLWIREHIWYLAALPLMVNDGFQKCNWWSVGCCRPIMSHCVYRPTVSFFYFSFSLGCLIAAEIRLQWFELSLDSSWSTWWAGCCLWCCAGAGVWGCSAAGSS